MERHDPFEEAEIAAAEAEAGDIGGTAGDEDLPDAERPVREAGGGESEGFEEAEEQLIDNASHGDEHSARMALYDAGEPEEAGQDTEYGESDREYSPEADDDR